LLHAHLPEPQIPPCRPPPLQSAPLLSAARLVPFRRSLCPSCACLLLPVHRVVFFLPLLFNWATPVKLCSCVFCMLIDCLLHQFLGSIQERVRVPHCVFACRLSRLLRASLTIFVKRCCTISRTTFTSSEPAPRSFMIFSK